MFSKKAPILILPFAVVSLVVGIMAGLERINWDVPLSNFASDHGALMTGSFIGTLICLERTITHANKWWRFLPLITGLSLFFFFAHQPLIAYLFLIGGSFGLLILLLTFLRESRSLTNLLLVLGAFAWLTGNLSLFNQQSYLIAVKWWMLFYLWTIFGERLELNRMLPFTRTKRITLFMILPINIAGAILPFHWHGNEIFAISLISLSFWLLIYDMSRYAIKYPGQHRYIGLWLLSGYAWLLVTGLWILLWSHTPFGYDAVLHSFFLGFVFSAIIGHAPIIFPGVFKINISLYHPLLYVIFFLFHSSLVGRILGDALLDTQFRKWSAMMNGIAIILFLICTLAIVLTRMKIKEKRNVSIER